MPKRAFPDQPSTSIATRSTISLLSIMQHDTPYYASKCLSATMQNLMYALRHYIDALYQTFIYKTLQQQLKRHYWVHHSNSLKRHKLFANGTELQISLKQNHSKSPETQTYEPPRPPTPAAPTPRVPATAHSPYKVWRNPQQLPELDLDASAAWCWSASCWETTDTPRWRRRQSTCCSSPRRPPHWGACSSATWIGCSRNWKKSGNWRIVRREKLRRRLWAARGGAGAMLGRGWGARRRRSFGDFGGIEGTNRENPARESRVASDAEMLTFSLASIPIT